MMKERRLSERKERPRRAYAVSLAVRDGCCVALRARMIQQALCNLS